MRAHVLLILLLPLCSGAQPSDHAVKRAATLLKSNPTEAIAILNNTLDDAQKSSDTLFAHTLMEVLALGLPSDVAEGIELESRMSGLYDASRYSDKMALAWLWYRLADLHEESDLPKDSLLHLYDRSVSTLLKAGQTRGILAERCYQAIGDIYKYWLYRADEAEKWYVKSLEILESIPQESPYRMIRVYYNLATSNRTQGDYENALSYGMACIQRCKEARDFQMLEQTYSAVANIYRDMNQVEEAKKHYNLAIDLNRQRNDYPLMLAWHRMGLAQALAQDSLYEEALTNFRQADVVFDEAHHRDQLAGFFRPVWIYGLVQYAETAQALRQPEITHKILLKARQLAFDFGETNSKAEVSLGLGNYFSNANQDSLALAHYHESLLAFDPEMKGRPSVSIPSIPPDQSNSIVFLALFGRAKVLMRQEGAEPMRLALKNLELAEAVFLNAQNAVEGEESRWKRLEKNYNVYEQMVNCAYQLHKIADASMADRLFGYIEKSKAVELRRSLAVRAEGRRTVADTLVQSLNSIKRTWFTLSNRINSEKRKAAPDLLLLRQLHENQVVLDRRIQHYEQKVREALPGYSRLMNETNGPLIREIQRHLPSDTWLIEYFSGDQNIYAIAISNRTYRIHRLESSAVIKEALNLLMKHFHEPHSSLDVSVYSDFVLHSHQMYKLLVEPFSDLFHTGDELRFIPDGWLNFIPFEALIQEPAHSSRVDYRSLGYLIRDFRIGYALSASLLNQEVSRESKRVPMLAMGYSGAGTSEEGTTLDAIAGALTEVMKLKERSTGIFLTGEEVTEGNFKRYAPEAERIHLAVHGVGDMEDGYSSRLYFAGERDSSEDGRLHAYELLGFDVDAYLVVLSACESGYGKVYRGQGMMGLASAFAFAGTSNTIMGLWKVGDQSSAVLMDDFYQNLDDGDDITAALSQAKLNFIHEADEYTADPLLWASLVEFGNYNSRKASPRMTSLGYGLVAGLVLMVLLYFRFRRR